MSLPKWVISICSTDGDVHIVDFYFAETAVIAAYMVAGNELGLEFADNEARSDFSLDEAIEEFQGYGYYLHVRLHD